MIRHAIETASTDDVHRVLIVDDETAVLFACRILFGSEGFAVDLCTTLEQAVEQLHANSYLAVIADIRLKGLGNRDGLELLKIARKLQPESKVLIMTGYGNAATEQESLEIGASFYFEKPVEPSIILEILRVFRQDRKDNSRTTPPGKQ